MAKDLVVVIAADGSARHLLDDAHASLFDALGETVKIERVSHIDVTGDLSPAAFAWLVRKCLLPGSLDWWADMLPVGGPVLGPFVTRQEALTAETAYLNAENIPERRRDNNEPAEQPQH